MKTIVKLNPTNYVISELFMKRLLFILLLSSIFGTVTDIDGNVYETIIINGQNWIAENLAVTRFNNGDEISLVDPMSWFQQYVPTYHIDEISNTYGFY